MNNRFFINCNIMVLLLTLCIIGVCWGENTPVKIGVLAKRGAQRCLKKWSPTAEYLTARIPAETFVIVPLNHEQIYTSVENEEVDFILANPSFYVDLESRYGVNRIATLKNFVLGEVYTIYGGVIFCQANRSDIRCIGDLNGKSFMAVDETSLGGWIAALRELKEKGIDPSRHFSELRFGGTHDAVVYAVRDGTVDAGTVRTDTLERMHAEGKINLSNFYIISYDSKKELFPFVCSTRMYPEWPFAKVKHTPGELAEAVAKALLDMPPDSPAAIASRCAGWTIPKNYRSVHKCLMELRLGPYKDWGKITLSDVIKNYWPWILLTAFFFLIMTSATIVILNLNRKIKTSYEKLEIEFNERKRTEIKLIKAKEAAEAATRAKSEFLANMSHEIRTPMNGVIVAADLALSEELPPKAKHYLKTIHSSAYSLLGIINNILDFSKIETEKLDLEERPFMLDELLGKVTDMFIDKAAKKRIELLVDIDLEAPKALIGDPLRLQQILANLVSNAVKFTEKGGGILLGVKESPEKIKTDQVMPTFFVKDTGIGIAPEYLPKLFEPFSQADTSMTRKYGGAGLGLSICKKLVEMMDGSIWVESELGKGSTFTFTARFGRQPADQERKLVPPPDIQGLNVLVVDDSKDSRIIMKKMLGAFGFHVKSVSSGEEALKRLKENQTRENSIELVMMDWMMPELDGIETSRRIRNDLKLTIPILLMTAFGKETEKLDAEKAWVNGFLTKPIFQSMLFNAILDAFGKKELRREIEEKPIITDYKKRLRGIRILVVEDNPTNQEIVLAILERAGIVAEIANNGKEAIEAVQREYFDAILMDAQMPIMDGYEATRTIRKDPSLKSLPIIAMTAHAMKGDEEKCLEAGMDDYVSKPISQDRLFHTIWKLVKDRKRPPLAKEPEAVAAERRITKIEELPQTLPGINIQEALKVLNIDNDTFKRILIGFLSYNKDTMNKIRAALGQKDWESLRQLAHNLKGSAGNIGAYNLYQAAQELETACREETVNPPPSSLIDKMETALNQVLVSLQILIAPPKIEPLYGKEKKVVVEQLELLLKQLADALDLADPEVVAKHMDTVKKHLDSSIIQDLENQINDYDYDEAFKTIKRIIENIRGRLG